VEPRNFLWKRMENEDFIQGLLSDDDSPWAQSAKTRVGI